MILISIDLNLNKVDSETIWWSNLINNLTSAGQKVSYVCNYKIVNDKNTRNLDHPSLVTIINCAKRKINGAQTRQTIEQWCHNLRVKQIIIKSNELLEVIDHEWPLLNKCKIYVLPINLKNIIKLNNGFNQICCINSEIEKLYLKNGILPQKISINPPVLYKYNSSVLERTDNEIRLIYVGSLRPEEKILEMIEIIRSVRQATKDFNLTICYAKIEGNPKFCEKMNKIINDGVDGVTFKYNLHHKAIHQLIAHSDVGICWRKKGDTRVRTKVKEYKLYLETILDNFDLNNLKFLLQGHYNKKISLRSISAISQVCLSLPLISILMPVFNNKEDVITAINSVTSQTLNNWELIIIDDHSTDGTVETILTHISSLRNYSSQIKFLTNKVNRGVYISLNIGLQNSSGKYICRLDSDDRLDPHMLEKQSKILDKDLSENYIATQSLFKRDDDKCNFGEIALMYRKSIIEKIGYYDSVRYAADTEFASRIKKIYGQNRIYKLYQPLYYYKLRTNSLTTSPITGLNSSTSGRHKYLISFKQWHEQNSVLYMPFPLVERPFPVDQKMLP